MDYENESGNLAIGDKVWWRRGEDVWGWTPQPPAPGYDPDKHYFHRRTIRVEASVLTGRVRSIGFEEPDFSYAVIACDPDGRLVQAPLHWLSKGTPPDPLPGSAEIPQSTEEPSDDDREVDEEIEEWGAQQP